MRVLLLVFALATLVGCGRKANKEREDDDASHGLPAAFGGGVRPVERSRADELPQPVQRPTKIGVRMPNGTPSVRQLFFSGREDGFETLLTVHDAAGKVLTSADSQSLLLIDPFLALTAPEDGAYYISVSAALPPDMSRP